MDEVIKAKRQQTTGSGMRAITIRGAREHNLKNIDLEIPRDRLVVFTGLSAPAIFARLRHHLRRGPAPLCRIAVGLCAPVPGDDAEAGRRPDRRAVAGDLDRAEDHLEKSALDGRHRHRNLRLHAAVVGAGRCALFARDGPADREPDRLADGRSRAGAAGRHPALSAGAGGARPQGRIPQGARRISQEGISAGQDRRHVLRTGGSAGARQEIPARHRRRGRPHRGAARHRPAAGGKFSRPR